MMYKKDYNLFVTNVISKLSEYGTVTQDKYAHYIDTPCGKLRVAIEEFKPKQRTQWLYTKIENPDTVPQIVRNEHGFNKFCGKYNNYGYDFHILFDWFSDYLKQLFSIREEL